MVDTHKVRKTYRIDAPWGSGGKQTGIKTGVDWLDGGERRRINVAVSATLFARVVVWCQACRQSKLQASDFQFRVVRPHPWRTPQTQRLTVEENERCNGPNPLRKYNAVTTRSPMPA